MDENYLCGTLHPPCKIAEEKYRSPKAARGVTIGCIQRNFKEFRCTSQKESEQVCQAKVEKPAVGQHESLWA
jgi:hypothetical protein